MKNSLEERVRFLEDRVEALEKQLQLQRTEHERMTASKQQFTTKQQAEEKQLYTQPTLRHASQTVQQHVSKQHTHKPNKTILKKQSKKSEPIQWDVLIFQKLLPRVFIFILVLGVLWGLKAAYDFGIITIHIILALGILLAVAMAILGSIQIKKDRRILGQVLIGGSIPVFMLTIFSMHQLYDMIGPSLAFILNVVAIIVGIMFTYQFRSQSIGIITSVAGVLVPYLIESTEPNFYLFVSYEAILYLLFLSLSLYLTFKGLYIVSTLFLHVAILALYIFSYVPPQYELLTVFPIIMQQIALFGGLVLTKVSLRTQSYTVLTSLILTALWVNSILDTIEATAIYIGLSMIHLLGYYLFRNDNSRASILIVNASLAFLFIFLVNELEIAYEVLLVVTIIYLYYAQKFKTQLHYILAAIQYFIAFSLFGSYYIAEWLSFEMLHKITFLLATIVIIYLLVKAVTTDKIKKQLLVIGLPYFALLLLFFASDLTYLIIDGNHLDDSGPLILSSFWVFIAIGYMIFSRFTGISVGKFVGVAVLFLTVAKVILIDISFMSMVFRAILFIGLGIIGLIISRVYYKR